VPCDEHAVFGRDEIRLDEIRAHLGAEAVAFERVFRSMAARTAVRDDERLRRLDRHKRQQQHERRRGFHHSSLNPN
jgi:hypothetical protein